MKSSMLESVCCKLFVSSLLLISLIHAYSISDLLADLQSDENVRRSFDPSKSNEIEETGNGYSMLSSGVPDNFKCQKLREPKNGKVRCGGTLCLVQCNPGYIQSVHHAFVYQCGATNKWTTIPAGKNIPWPDCDELTYIEK